MPDLIYSARVSFRNGNGAGPTVANGMFNSTKRTFDQVLCKEGDKYVQFEEGQQLHVQYTYRGNKNPRQKKAPVKTECFTCRITEIISTNGRQKLVLFQTN